MSTMRIYFYLLSCALLLSFLSNKISAQSATELKDPAVNFGLQAGVIFPSTLFRVRANEAVSEGIVYSIDPKTGVQFGGTTTFRLSSKWQLQAGMMLLMRNYDGVAASPDERLSLSFRTTIYEVPILMTYYQRIGNQMLLSLGTGVNMQSLPSNLRVTDGRLDVFSVKRSFTVPSSLTTAGIEFRKKDAGGFFIGLSYCITPFPLYDTRITARFDGVDRFFVLPHIGDYFSIVGRYYLD